MNPVLVTGGAGYVGSHAVKALAAAGRDVLVLDNLGAGHAEAVARIASAFPKQRIELVEGDTSDAPLLAETFAREQPSAVMHFAAWLSVPASVADPAGYYRNNVIGTLTLLEAMVAAKITRLVFSSTCAVFGEPEVVPIDELHPRRPINAYGETKLAIERALEHFDIAYGLKSVALRYFNASGADPDGLLGEDHDPEIHLIPRAIAAAVGGEALQVFGDDYPTPDGTCQRDYVHVDDLAQAHLLSLARLEEGGGSARFNLGNGAAISVREVIDAVERVSGRKVPFVMSSRRPGDPARLVASSALAHAELGWRPRLAAIDDIVGTAWRWHAAHPGGYSSIDDLRSRRRH
ncbi:MAG: UDP-glucose 4-epimerase GalE [Acidobacteriota bacterium]|nr:UDP-glucose 4-epimerase GalE [Acidobacteriota bacterium]